MRLDRRVRVHSHLPGRLIFTGGSNSHDPRVVLRQPRLDPSVHDCYIVSDQVMDRLLGG